MKMAAGLAGMAFVPYFNHLMKLLDTNSDLKKSAKGWYILQLHIDRRYFPA